MVEVQPAVELPRTGSNVVPMLVGAAVLLLVGTALVISTRRRHDGEPTTV